jgi:hypothetical protein
MTMLRTSFVISALFLLVGGCWGSSDTATKHRVNVTVLRRESVLRSSTGNRDAYLVRVTPAKGRPFDARMIDRYPGYAEGMPASYIGENIQLSVELRRAPSCDEPAVESVALTDAGEVRCFELVHQSWRSPKGQSVDEWWK